MEPSWGAMAISGIKQDHNEYPKIAAIVARCLPILADSLNHRGMATICDKVGRQVKAVQLTRE